MPVEQWYLGLLVALAVGHAILVYRAYRPRDRRESGDWAGSGPEGPANSGSGQSPDTGIDEASVVECPSCGTENEVGYRYCRSCVADLPDAIDFEDITTRPLGRLIR